MEIDTTMKTSTILAIHSRSGWVSRITSVNGIYSARRTIEQAYG
jgi:hypothetical protein